MPNLQDYTVYTPDNQIADLAEHQGMTVHLIEGPTQRGRRYARRGARVGSALVLPFFLFLFIPTLVTLPAIVAVNKRPLDCLVGANVIVLTKGSSEPPVEPGVSISGKHRSHESTVKITRHGPQQVAMARLR